MGESSIRVEGLPVQSPTVRVVLNKLRPRQTNFSLPELAELRMKELDQNGDGKPTDRDYYEGEKVSQPRQIWKTNQIKFKEFQDVSSYLNHLLVAPVQAKIVRKVDYTSPTERGTLLIAFAKDFHEVKNLDELEARGSPDKKLAEGVSPYMIRIIFSKDGSATFQLIDRRVEEGEIYASRSKLYRVEKRTLDCRRLNLSHPEGTLLEEPLKDYLWQIVTKEGDFKS